MYCEKCGTKLHPNAEFCSNCGTKVITEKSTSSFEKNKDTETQLRIQPTFKFNYLILPSLIIYGTIIIIYSIFIMTLNILIGIITLIISYIFLGIILAIKTAIIKQQYNSFYFDFYKTKIIYKDSFININEKEIKYKNIKEISMHQSFIQRFFNIGNIILYTNAETLYGNGIKIINVDNIKNIYKTIKKIMNI